ncbi:PREDICTED: plant intracellular Ras-group-related LRR protein 5-like [Priapulus caudatus]|uniref:Plant intracellular Ras-group-related LRR protein 5-like n=1 Tax=Priapulus caudatus TaxID=37621 RepID=A0ABM1DVA7_PRICU|nr:PREDICTED: plant intracellular Ras-group-related LRR protein 5-like [Priapulus caudatus]
MVVEEACRTKPHEIDVSYMHLTCCPSRIGFIGVQLASLNMSNNRLPDIPEEIGCLRGLQELFLQYNCLTSLPKGIGRLEQLYELDLKNNMLRSLPDAIGDLRALAVLNVTNNALESLPASIGRLTALREVSAHSNCLERLPVEICELSNVTTLYLGENPLRALPERISALRRLQELDVSDCALTRLPDALAQCGSLIRLWLSNNRLRELPAQIGRLQQLKELHVRNNALRYFPASLRMLRLYTFTAVNNPLVEEGESDAIAALQRRPASRVPPLLESCCRGVVAHGVAWEAAGLPRDLHNMLRAPRQCCNCGGPFFTYCQSSLVFDSIGMFFRVPIYQNICSPFRKNKCRPMVFQ